MALIKEINTDCEHNKTVSIGQKEQLRRKESGQLEMY